MTDRTVAPGLHHVAHSALGALPPVPVTLFVVAGVLLIVAVSAGVILLHLATGAPYVHRLAAVAPEVPEVAGGVR